MSSLIAYVYLWQSMWRGILHHVVNRHEWASGQCDHGHLDDNRDKEWLTAGTRAHEALTTVVLDKTFLGNIHHYVNFRYIFWLNLWHSSIQWLTFALIQTHRNLGNLPQSAANVRRQTLCIWVSGHDSIIILIPWMIVRIVRIPATPLTLLEISSRQLIFSGTKTGHTGKPKPEQTGQYVVVASSTFVQDQCLITVCVLGVWGEGRAIPFILSPVHVIYFQSGDLHFFLCLAFPQVQEGVQQADRTMVSTADQRRQGLQLHTRHPGGHCGQMSSGQTAHETTGAQAGRWSPKHQVASRSCVSASTERSAQQAQIPICCVILSTHRSKCRQHRQWRNYNILGPVIISLFVVHVHVHCFLYHHDL